MTEEYREYDEPSADDASAAETPQRAHALRAPHVKQLTQGEAGPVCSYKTLNATWSAFWKSRFTGAQIADAWSATEIAAFEKEHGHPCAGQEREKRTHTANAISGVNFRLNHEHIANKLFPTIAEHPELFFSYLETIAPVTVTERTALLKAIHAVMPVAGEEQAVQTANPHTGLLAQAFDNFMRNNTVRPGEVARFFSMPPDIVYKGADISKIRKSLDKGRVPELFLDLQVNSSQFFATLEETRPARDLPPLRIADKLALKEALDNVAQAEEKGPTSKGSVAR